MIDNILFTPMICTMVFVLGDIATGFTKALATHNVQSKVMRSGMWHKIAIIFLIVTALAAAVTCQMWDALPNELSAVYPAVCLYICLMELVSILENISEINPDLKAKKLFELFHIDKE